MLTVTAAARVRLVSKLTHKQAPDDVAMRMSRIATGWRLDPDRAVLGDTVFAHEGRSVLLLDAAVAEGTATMTLDARDTARGTRLKLRPLERGGD